MQPTDPALFPAALRHRDGRPLYGHRIGRRAVDSGHGRDMGLVAPEQRSTTRTVVSFHGRA